jgi:hypothetical protein
LVHVCLINIVKNWLLSLIQPPIVLLLRRFALVS